MSVIIQRRRVPALFFGLAVLAGLYALVVPVGAQAADGPPRVVAAATAAAVGNGPANPQIGEPSITASAVVVEAGTSATLYLVNGPPPQPGMRSPCGTTMTWAGCPASRWK